MFDWIDIAFIATAVLLTFNGLRNGAIVSLVNLISIPAGFAVAWLFGPSVTVLLANNHIPATPIISFNLLFFGTVLVLHIIATIVRRIVRSIPIIGGGDALIGALIGFVESCFLWGVVLIILHNFLQDIHNVPGIVDNAQFRSWQDFYNEAVTHSIFAHIIRVFVPL